MGNIYRICAQLMRELLPQPQATSAHQQHSSLPEIEKALELIYNHYAENITIDDIEQWRYVVEDVKSYATKTRVYEMKKQLMLEKFKIRIREV